VARAARADRRPGRGPWVSEWRIQGWWILGVMAGPSAFFSVPILDVVDGG